MSDPLDKIERLENLMQNGKPFRYGDIVYMTGAEWYDRVSVELERIAQSHAEPVQNLNYSDFIDALKRAAGIADKPQGV